MTNTVVSAAGEAMPIARRRLLGALAAFPLLGIAPAALAAGAGPDAELIDLADRMQPLQAVWEALLAREEEICNARMGLARGLYDGPCSNEGEPMDKLLWCSCLDRAGLDAEVTSARVAIDAFLVIRRELEAAACKRPALTMQGLIAKARIALFDGGDCEPDVDVSASVVNDLMALAAQVQA